jgi:hypothetical protein
VKEIKKMKHKFLFFAILIFVGLFVPLSYCAGPVSNPTFNFVLTNDIWDSHMVYEVDLIILSTDGTNDIELASFGMGLTVNNTALNGGIITASWVPGSSQLTNTTQIPTTLNTATLSGALRVIKIVGKVPPGAGGGSMLSHLAPGTRIGRLRLTNTVDWVIIAPNTIDTAAQTIYPKGILAYVGGLNVDISKSGTYIKNLSGPLLPVELTSFISNVSGRQVNLSWETKTEVNTNKFEIDRALVSKKDATVTWASVGIVPASGNSSAPKKYSYTEKNLQAGKYQYRLKMIDNSGSYKFSDLVETEIALPKNFEISQNYPNPFNPSTKINYSLPFDSRVTLEVYNITGERMGQIVNQEQSAGYYTVNFSSSTLNRSIASGVYIYKINAVDKSTGNVFTSIKKMMLLK